MRRRNCIKDITYALCQTFNSRNNDFGGYWGVGVLYRHAVNCGVDEVSIDLLSQKVAPANKRLTEIAQYYGDYIHDRAMRFYLPQGWITSARIRLRFNCDEGAKAYRGGCGDPYVFDVTLRAKSGFSCMSSTTGYCWPHDAQRERRR